MIPFFAGPASATGRTILTVGIVLAVMILPIMTALCREIFLQTPRLHEEAALALGATRWEMIRMTVFPYARSGMVSAAMLGLGRALGETMAVAMVLSVTGVVTLQPDLHRRTRGTIAANIALKFPEASGIEVNMLIATGLVLFVITFASTSSRAADRRPPQASSREPTDMSRHRQDRSARRAPTPVSSRTSARAAAAALDALGRRSVVAVALVLALGIVARLGACALSVVAGLALVYVVVLGVRLTASSRAAARAKDRLATAWSPAPSSLALIPLGHLALAGRQQRAPGAQQHVPHVARCATSSARAAASTTPSSGTLLVTGLAAVIRSRSACSPRSTWSSTARAGWPRWITFLVDVMTGIPSIVAGLFAYALFVIFFGAGVRMGSAARSRCRC